MFAGRVGTIYTSPTDTWDSVQSVAGLDRNELTALNPHLKAVKEIEPGIPMDVPWAARAKLLKERATAAVASAYDVAKKELLLNVAQDPRPGQDHPRIVLYHSTTSSGAEPDEVAWCSSFVNFCTEQAGQQGTDSKGARSWLGWGVDVPKSDWREGDVIVFKRGNSTWKGHVGFLVDWLGPRPSVLGGNQSTASRSIRPTHSTPFLGFAAVLDGHPSSRRQGRWGLGLEGLRPSAGWGAHLQARR